MQPLDFEQTVKKITDRDHRFHAEAYFFVRDALDFTRGTGSRSRSGTRDVSSKELLEGLRRHALETYGPMALTVLAEWGVHRCEDFGQLVFNLIEHNFEGRSETDSLDDFKNGYTFEDAFRKPFLPVTRLAESPKPVEA